MAACFIIAGQLVSPMSHDRVIDFGLRGKSAVVIGGGGGIGGAIVAELIRQGCNVIATAVSDEEIAEQRAFLANAAVRWHRLDVADDDAVQELARSIDRLDILVNCAGITVRGPAAIEEDAFLRVVDINLHGTMRSCRAFRAALAAARGAIVNIASMMSMFGSGTAVGYAASKGGVSQLTKSLAIAWAEDRIRVNAVAPGWIETPMTRTAIMASSPELYERVKLRTPMRRWGAPENIARAIPFLVSSYADFVTGVIFPVDGGYSAA